MQQLPTLKFLNECFTYNPTTGDFNWKTRPLHHFKNKHGMDNFNSRMSGLLAGNKVVGPSHRKVILQGTFFPVSRIIWKMVNGTDATNSIKFKDGDPTNFKYSNLMMVTPTTKRKKLLTMRQVVTPGFKYVSQTKSGKFAGAKRINGRKVHFGTFKTAKDAHTAVINGMKLIKKVAVV